MSSTAAQLTANRANAHHSTGPVTPEGKAASARNAFRHGFRSQTVLLPGDDPADYQTLLDQLQSQFPPRDLTGERCLREMADAEWRLRRARAHQQSMLSRKIQELFASCAGLSPEEIEISAYEQLAASSAYFRQLPSWEEKFRRQYDRAWQMWASHQTLARKTRRAAFAQAVEDTLLAPLPTVAQPPAPEPPPEKDTNEANPPAAITPRNALCPCGSREKYKRRCGKPAPSFLCAA